MKVLPQRLALGQLCVSQFYTKEWLCCGSYMVGVDTMPGSGPFICSAAVEGLHNHARVQALGGECFYVLDGKHMFI